MKKKEINNLSFKENFKYYNLEVEDVFKVLKTNKDGLSYKEAYKRLIKDGKNKLLEAKKESKLTKFFNEFKDLMIIILIIASLISFILSILNNEPFTDSIIIIAIVILNAVLGFIQEMKAYRVIESLKKMQKVSIKVKRDKKICIIDSFDIVKGDILILEAGDTVPCDARIISNVSLKVDESSLTGESVPVSKNTLVLDSNTPLSLRKNMIYQGCNIVYGKCQAVACETGMNTEFGNIAKCLNENKNEATPLQKKINGISRFLSMIILFIIVIMFIIGLIKGMALTEVLMLSISLAVAAIPEGLPAVITITLSLGMSSMAKKRAIVRKMASVETLGSTNIICTDKTGTITKNEMKVREVVFNNNICSCKDLGNNANNHKNILLSVMALNNDVIVTDNNFLGDPTEIALYKACLEVIDVNSLKKENKRIDELPFDSNRKMMSTINKNKDGIRLYTKGSFDSLIKCCSYIYENGKVIKLNKEKIRRLKNAERCESSKAYRVLAFAYKDLDSSYVLDNSLENNLIFVGMASMIDPPRDGVKEAIKTCKEANIKPVMISGDSLSTSCAIAKEVGILSNDNEAITGQKLDEMDSDTLRKNVFKYSVYARVSPMNKLAIVNAFKENGMIVAMTGDGVNDAPALKNADIGIGMGKNGTEVAKDVSSVILADDSFNTIVTSVKEGRRIFDNIRKVLLYLLTGNITEILIVFTFMLFGIEIFSPIELLYINLITDSIPAIALAFEKAEENIMKRKVRDNKSSFFTPFITFKMISASVLKAIVVALIYFMNFKLYNVEVANTMAFFSLILLEIAFAYSCRNLKKSVINKNIFDNHYMNKSIILLIILQIIIFATPLRNIFNIVNLNMLQVLHCILIVILVFLIDEIAKRIINTFFKD